MISPMNLFKRMGSASSSSSKVKSFSVNQEETDERPDSAKTRSSRSKLSLKDDQEVLQRSLDEAQSTINTQTKEIVLLKDQIKELEQINATLTEENLNLQHRLESTEAVASQSNEFEDVLHSKTIEINHLEDNLRTAEENIKTLKDKYTNKLKSLRASSGKKAQDASLQIFELKDEVNRLTAENEELNRKLVSAGIEPSEGHSLSNNHSDVIIELSTQISDQEYKIGVLESEIREKDELIAKLTKSEISPREAHSIIQVEAEKASEELKCLAKELKMVKKRKRKVKQASRVAEENELSREHSVLSKDSGAGDLLPVSDFTSSDALNSLLLATSAQSNASNMSTLVT